MQLLNAGQGEILEKKISNQSVDVTLQKDDLELAAVGYKAQMPRHFTMFSMMSLSFALTLGSFVF